MIDGLRVLAVVPARGGSKGIPRKNIVDLCGKPLIAWTLDAAARSSHIDRCIVSTDDDEIATVVRQHGGDVPFFRPAELATDGASTFDALADVLTRLKGFDIIVVLQPTSPLRLANDIDATLETMQRHSAPSCVSVVEPGKSPFWAYRVDQRHRLTPLLDPRYSQMRRQDLPKSYVLNGAVYAARIDWLYTTKSFIGNETVPYEMPAERSVDIDTPFDLDVAALRLKAR